MGVLCTCTPRPTPPVTCCDNAVAIAESSVDLRTQCSAFALNKAGVVHVRVGLANSNWGIGEGRATSPQPYRPTSGVVLEHWITSGAVPLMHQRRTPVPRWLRCLFLAYYVGQIQWLRLGSHAPHVRSASRPMPSHDLSKTSSTTFQCCRSPTWRQDSCECDQHSHFSTFLARMVAAPLRFRSSLRI
jgi:hypothetical protein